MNIQVGDRVTYKINQTSTIRTVIIKDSDSIKILNNVLDYEILKIERPKYEVIEEKKELLTKEEKEFLKSYIKIIESLNNGETVNIRRQSTWIIIELKTGLEYPADIGPRFKELEDCRLYTLEELELQYDNPKNIKR